MDSVYKKQLEAVQEVSTAVSGVLDLDEILNIATNRLVKLLKLHSTGIHLFDGDDVLISERVDLSGKFLKWTEKFLDGKIENLKIPITLKSNVIVKTFLKQKTYEIDELHKFGIGILSKTQVDILQKISKVKKVLSIPLSAKGEKLGVLTVAFYKNEIKEEERNIAITFANQIATAIYNAKLHTKVQNQVEELNTLLKQKDQFFAIVNHQLKTDVTLLKTYAYKLQKEEKSDEQLEKIISATSRLATTTNDLIKNLESENIKKPKKESVNLSGIIDDFTKEYQSLLTEKKVIIKKKLKKALK